MSKIAEDPAKKNGVDNEVHRDNNEKNTKNKYEMILAMEDSILTEDTYILGLCGTQTEPEYRIGAALSNGTCIIYNVGETLSKLTSLTHNSSPIVGIKFSPNSKNILYTATKQGIITACDLRAKGKVVAELKDDSTEGKLRPFASFDISCDDRLVAAGTEHIGGDAFILFWDVRYNSAKSDSKNNLLGGYWESLMDDVTCLAFHSNKQNILASGSTDGMINIFDLTQPAEDLALNYSLNTESSVDRIGWSDESNLWCTTHTHCLQLWNIEDASPFVRWDRHVISDLLDDDQDSCYLVRMEKPNLHEPDFLLAGSSSIKGESLSGIVVSGDGLEVCYDFIGNKQIVRDSWYHSKSGCLVTGGEGGFLNLWKPGETSRVQQTSDHKTSSKSNGKPRDKQSRVKPY